jgi:hypothetical protein
MGKTHSKPLAARHGRGTAWALHGNGMLCVNRPLSGYRASRVPVPGVPPCWAPLVWSSQSACWYSASHKCLDTQYVDVWIRWYEILSAPEISPCWGLCYWVRRLDSQCMSSAYRVDCVGNVMAHAQKSDFVFRWNGRVNLNRRARQFSWLLTAEVCASAVVMLHTPCSEVVWRELATHPIRQFPLHFPSRTSPCAITFQLDSTKYVQCGLRDVITCICRTGCTSWMAKWGHGTFKLYDSI